MMIVVPVGIAAVAVVLIAICKAVELHNDSVRESRGEKRRHPAPPISVIDWTRRN